MTKTELAFTLEDSKEKLEKNKYLLPAEVYRELRKSLIIAIGELLK